MIQQPTPPTGRDMDEMIDNALSQMREMTIDAAIDVCQAIADSSLSNSDMYWGAMRCVHALHEFKERAKKGADNVQS